MPHSKVDLVSRDSAFQQDCIVAGGVEWQRQSAETLAPAAFTRKVCGMCIQGNPLRIELNTSDCEPFDTLDNPDIGIWSFYEATSRDQSLHVRAHPRSSESYHLPLWDPIFMINTDWSIF